MYLCRDVGIKLGLGLTTGKVRWVGLYVSCDLVPFFRVGTRHVGTRYGGASMLTKVRSMRERERERERTVLGMILGYVYKKIIDKI